MKADLVVTAILFALFAGFHFFIAWEHYQVAGRDASAGIAPALIGIAAAATSWWGFRLARSASGSAG